MPGARNIFKPQEATPAIEQASARYHKLALAVGPSGSGKTNLLREVSQQMQFPMINLGLDLSRKLLPLTQSERKLRVSDIIADILDSHSSPRLAVDDTEIIFDPSLMLNPLGILQTISRTRFLLWAWNGTVEGDHLTYAYPGHPEHQRIPATDMTLIIL